jgi:hypothetical protein
LKIFTVGFRPSAENLRIYIKIFANENNLSEA